MTDRPPQTEQAPPAPDEPLIVVVGGDALALAVCAELRRLRSGRVSLLWHARSEAAGAAERMGAAFTQAAPDRADGLIRAGVPAAASILALSDDDRLNLHVALRARDINPGIRIVLRQFNRTLGRKIEQNLADCSVVSLASQSAATYAAASLDPSCFYGLQFPDIDGPLVGFVRRRAEECGVAGLTLAEAERRLGARIVLVDGVAAAAPGTVVSASASLVVFGALATLEATAATPPPRRRRRGPRRGLRQSWQEWRRWFRRLDPIVVRLVVAAFAIFAAATWYFHLALQRDLLIAAYFVVTTMSTTGYGDIVPSQDDPLALVIAIVLMVFGVGFFGVFTAFASAVLNRAQQIRIQGLRPVHRSGHIIVCGAGNIGTAVIEYLLDLGKTVVVVERHPDTVLLEWAHERRIDLLTGDATRDATLDLCNLGQAQALVALSNSDTTNLEAALGARARNPALPLVLRIADAEFAGSIARHFQFDTTFSAAALAAPTFTRLSREPDARGRITIADRSYAILERERGPARLAIRASAILLALSRNGSVACTASLAETRPGDRLLFLEPETP